MTAFHFDAHKKGKNRVTRISARRLIAGLATLTLLPAVRAEIPDELLTSPLGVRFGLSPTIERPRLSPDGSKILYLQQDPAGPYLLQIADFRSGEIQTVLRGSEEEYDIGWCEWANATRVLCDGMYAVNADGSELKKIPPGRIREPPERQLLNCAIVAETRATQILFDWLPDEPDFVQRACGNGQRIDLYSGQVLNRRLVANVPGQVLSDGHGFARLQRYRNIDSAFDRWSFRTAEDGEWTVFHESNPIEFDDPFRPVGFGETTSELFHLAWDRDQGRWGLYGIDLSKPDLTSTPIFSHPDLDIELVDRMGVYGRVVAAAWLDGRPQRFVVDGPVAAAYQAAIEVFPEQNLEIVDESWDGDSYIVLVREAQRAGTFYLLDMRQGAMVEIGAEYSHLADVELAETRTVTFPGADGGTISGHLTLPAGSDGPVPAVIMPRGLPSRLDIADPHYLVQYLAASGYAVLRVNFRGAPEYGGWLAERTALGWEEGAADVGAAAAWLAAEGIAEPDRICAVGRDIGAYTAVMNNIVEPGRLACIVGIATVSDSRVLAGTLIDDVVGDSENIMRLGSPARRANEITAPVLLFHGNYDGIVSMFGHTLELARALEKADKNSQFIEYRYSRHDIDRAPYRTDMLTRIGAFLDLHIGTP